MSFSLNEVEGMAKRAARGAGFEWGIAEEAGKAVRMLAANDLPGPALLVTALTRNEGLHNDDVALISTEGSWTAARGKLCPLVAGAALADRAGEIATGRVFELGPTTAPLMLAPLVAIGAKASGVVAEFSWPGITLIVTPDGDLFAEAEGEAMSTESAAWVRCRKVECVPKGPPIEQSTRCSVPAAVWDRLNDFADRTYAPATAESRALGAGSDRIDDV